VAGSDSSWTNTSNLYISFFGTGSLAISDGGAVSSGYSAIGYQLNSEGSVTVAGSGSSWTNTGNLYIGLFGTGSLDISDGGAVSSSGNSFIGNNSDGDGSVTVAGSGSSWTNTGDLTIGYSGTGSLAISDGGAVTVDGTLALASAINSVGTLNIGGDEGEAAVAAGVLNADSVNGGSGTATLNFNHTNSEGNGLCCCPCRYLRGAAVINDHIIGIRRGSAIQPVAIDKPVTCICIPCIRNNRLCQA